MNNLLFSSRFKFLVIVVVAVLSMVAAYYFELVMKLEPCPLCMTQRFFICLAGLFGLIGLVHKPGVIGANVYSVLIALSSVAGSFFSGRQLWLQSLPPEKVPACGPPLDYIFNNFPILDALQVLLAGDGNCSEVTWQFLGLTMPAWVMIIFIGIALLALSNLIKQKAAL